MSDMNPFDVTSFDATTPINTFAVLASKLLIRLSAILYTVSLAVPALEFRNLDGSRSLLLGYQALLTGWLGVFVFQFAWFANIVLIIGAITFACKAWTPTFFLGGFALALTMNTLTLFFSALPGIDTPSSGGQLTQVGIGFILWVGSILAFTIAATINLRRASQLNLQSSAGSA